MIITNNTTIYLKVVHRVGHKYSCKKNEIIWNVNASTDIVLKYKRAKVDKTTLRNRQIYPVGYF